MINIQAADIHLRNMFHGIEIIVDMAKRFKNSIIFIDEAEKILGNGRYEEDNSLLGEFHQCLDGVDSREIQSIIILAVNDINRFGRTLLDRFVLVEFGFPSYDERLTYFKNKGEQVKLKLNYDKLALNTAKMSYREMDRFWNDLMFYHLTDKTDITDKVITKIARQFDNPPHQDIMFS